MRWPFRSETRADSATQLAVSAIEAQAVGLHPQPEKLAACRAVAGLYASAFAGASIEGAALSSNFLALAIRTMILQGESVFVLDVDGEGQFELLPVASWDITGAAHPASWRYRVDMTGPSGSAVKTVVRTGVVHLVWETSTLEPWRGVGPWQNSGHAAGAGRRRTRLRIGRARTRCPDRHRTEGDAFGRTQRHC